MTTTADTVQTMTVDNLVEDLKQLWLASMQPHVMDGLRPMTEEHFQLLAERLLGMFLMIKKDDVKKESIVNWMHGIDEQLASLRKILADQLGYIDPNAPDPKVEWAASVDERLDTLKQNQADMMQMLTDIKDKLNQ